MLGHGTKCAEHVSNKTLVFYIKEGYTMKLNGNNREGMHSGQQEEQSRRSRPKKRSNAGRTAAIVVCVVLILAFGAVAWYIGWEKPPERHGGGLVDPTYESAKPQATDAPEASAEPSAEPTEDPNAGAPATLNENMYTFLIVGLDQAANNTDTMMVGRIDTENHKIDVVSLPRDTLVNVSWSVKKLNTLYSADINTGGNGIDGLLDGLKDILGFQIDCYAVVDLTAFVELVDAIGGVDYNVPVNMNYYDPTQDLYINIAAGEQHLTGEEALKVVRFRSGYASADIGRIGTQQDFLKSVASQMLTLGNIPNLPTFIDIFEEYVETNMTTANLAYFARQFLMCKSEDINFHTLPGNYGDSIKGLSYVSIYLDEWLDPDALVEHGLLCDLGLRGRGRGFVLRQYGGLRLSRKR